MLRKIDQKEERAKTIGFIIISLIILVIVAGLYLQNQGRKIGSNISELKGLITTQEATLVEIDKRAAELDSLKALDLKKYRAKTRAKILGEITQIEKMDLPKNRQVTVEALKKNRAELQECREKIVYKSYLWVYHRLPGKK